MKEREFCVECDGVYIHHRMSYISGLVDYLMTPVEKIFGSVGRQIDPLASRVLNLTAPKIARALAKLNMATILEKPDAQDSLRVRCLWEEAAKRGIKMREVRLFNKNAELFIAEYKDKNNKNRVLVFDTLPRPSGRTSKALMWMDNKAIMRKKLKAAGIPIANGDVRGSLKSALKLFSRLDKPVIAKPHLGSQARHTTIHINTASELEKGFKSAKRLSPWVIVEEELKGTVFRGTIIDGKVSGVMRRDPPHVTGDGKHTIEELVKIENKNPGRNQSGPGQIFHPIALDKVADDYLASQKIDRNYVPKKGEYILVGEKFAKARGSSRSEVTEITHPDNIKLLEKIYEAVKDPIIGVDFIVEDISKPWHEQPKSGVIELNAVPFIDLHHYVLFGQPKNIAGAIWDLVLEMS